MLLEGRVPPRPDGNDSIGGPGTTRAKGRGGTHPSMSAQRLRGREAFGVRQLAGAVASRPASQSRTGSVRSLVAAAISRMRTGDCEPAEGGPVLKAVVTAGRGSVRSPFVRQAVRLDGRPGAGCGTHTQRRQAAAVHALPRLPTAPSTSRSVWSAPACWRCRRATARLETYHPAPAFHKRPDGLLTRRHCPFEGPVPPGPRDAVERIPPRPDGVAAVPPIGGTSALRSIRWDNIRLGRQVPPWPRSHTPTTMRTSECGLPLLTVRTGCTSTTDWAR